ncbi:MAG: hypothetical protein Q9168_006507 [Polycauliona sp. 1 TL-2023]
MKDRTHDISLIDYHVKDVETLGKVLNKAAAAAFPRSGTSRYCDVYVLLLSWEDDDLDVVQEVDDLEQVFRDDYRYRVERWKIPSTTSHNSLVYRMMQALRDFESDDKLFIAYYAGHGFMNDDRQCVWLSNQRPGAATLQWSSIQTMLEEAECDVLILLDCCAAASSGGNHGKGVTEVIAACGFEAFAPGVGEHSFTRSLINELKYLSRRCDAITTALLHNKVLARIKKSWYPRYSDNGSSEERRRTPIHIHLSDDTSHRCIKLGSLQPLRTLHSSSSSSAPSTSASEDVEMTGSEGTSQSSLGEVWPDVKFESPKVLVTVNLQEDQHLHTESWLEWLKSVPALANFVQVEGVFKSDSTLLLLTLPVALWDSIPKDPAVTFTAFVRSHNICLPASQPKNIPSIASVSESRPGTQQPFTDYYLMPNPPHMYSDSRHPWPPHPDPAYQFSPTESRRAPRNHSSGSYDSGYASSLHSYSTTVGDSIRSSESDFTYPRGYSRPNQINVFSSHNLNWNGIYPYNLADADMHRNLYDDMDEDHFKGVRRKEFSSEYRPDRDAREAFHRKRHHENRPDGKRSDGKGPEEKRPEERPEEKRPEERPKEMKSEQNRRMST